jgi:hypothetical protein
LRTLAKGSAGPASDAHDTRRIHNQRESRFLESGEKKIYAFRRDDVSFLFLRKPNGQPNTVKQAQERIFEGEAKNFFRVRKTPRRLDFHIRKGFEPTPASPRQNGEAD